jgi:hypothetical protein
MPSPRQALVLSVSLLVALPRGAALLPAIVLTGRALDAEGTPRPGVRVSVAPLLGATTDADGRFELTVPRAVARGASVSLTARGSDYEPQRQSVGLRGDTVFTDLVLRAAVPPAPELGVDADSTDAASSGAPPTPKEN